MEYTSEHDEDTGICTVQVSGRHKRPEDSLALQQLARELGQQHGCQKFLFDMRQAEIIGGIMDIYEIGTVPVDTDHSQHWQRIALLYAGDLTDHKFLETVATNRWYQLRVFNIKEEAIAWLLSGPAITK